MKFVQDCPSFSSLNSLASLFSGSIGKQLSAQALWLRQLDSDMKKISIRIRKVYIFNSLGDCSHLNQFKISAIHC